MKRAKKKDITVHPETPAKLTGLTVHKPKSVAAGMPAVISALSHVFGAMGAKRGVKALLKVNQKDGFDCPGCAWPDPDDERSRIGEYCENGAKAIAEEATTKKLDPLFFSKHSVGYLASLSDYEIGKMGRIAQPKTVAE